ncbi:MAG: hypothetical protein QOD75_2780 [Blastocatellia bacterium]|jgi:hypothetical protein|nr:hypothetical protein [Blastocatellia bacterium]
MKPHAAWLAGALILTAVLACKYSTNSNSNTNSDSGSGAISKIVMAKDNNGDPGDETNTFKATDHTVHCLATLRNPKEGTKIKFSWWIVDSPGHKNELVKDIDYTTSNDKVVHGHLSLPRDWPTGKYKCDVYVDGVLGKSIEYYVE